MTKNALFLDDIRDLSIAFDETLRAEYLDLQWDIVMTYDEFCKYITDKYNNEKKLPEIISFDHDLDHEHYNYLEHPIPYEKLTVKTGYHCATWLKDFCYNNSISYPKVCCHSRNPAGKENILNLFLGR